MSHAASHPASHGHAGSTGHAGHHHSPDPAKALAHDNIHAPGFGGVLPNALIALGLLGLAGVAAGWFMLGEKGPMHALAAYHVGVIVVLGLCLGPLGIMMIMHQVSAGWVTTLRRQMENAAGLIWFPLLLLIPVLLLAKPAHLFHWMSVDPAADELLNHKRAFLNIPVFVGSVVFYGLVWFYLSRRLNTLSRTQDQTGDRWLTNKAKFTSAWGLLAFGLTCAFASFHLVKALDYHWFSTMFGVYFFAGNMISSLALMALLFALIRGSGKLEGLVTSEHFHDLGKLMLGFTVFWAYIAFSQYFLIWYANLPEETGWFRIRSVHGWETFGTILMFGHFIAPFLVLLFRGTKRSPFLLATVAIWLIAMHAIDVFWQIRPIVYPDKMGLSWVDLAGLLGPLALFFGLLLKKVGQGPLIPIKDPRLTEALEHKNYV